MGSTTQQVGIALLDHAVVTAHAWEGFTIAMPDGRSVTLAVIDDTGRVLESGPVLVNELWLVAIMAYRRFLVGEKAVTACSSPEGLFLDTPES
jgi:hypothetical protein